MLRLIKSDETRDVKLGETTFKVRLQTHAKARTLRLKHTHRGRVDEPALAAAFWQEHLVGWDKLANGDGSLIPFDPALVVMVVDNLPDDVITVLTMEIRDAQVAHAEALGNSKPSSGNAS